MHSRETVEPTDIAETEPKLDPFTRLWNLWPHEGANHSVNTLSGEVRMVRSVRYSDQEENIPLSVRVCLDKLKHRWEWGNLTIVELEIDPQGAKTLRVAENPTSTNPNRILTDRLSWKKVDLLHAPWLSEKRLAQTRIVLAAGIADFLGA